MNSLLYKSYPDLATLVLRVVAGCMMIPHGWGKFQKLINGNLSFADPLGIGEVPSLLLAIFAELFCAALVVVGFNTRLASIPVVVTMLVASLIVHSGDAFNKIELPLLYAAAFMATALLGSGKVSIDGALGKNR